MRGPRGLRLAFLLSLLASAVILAEATEANAALYVGGSHGTRVTFRIKGNEVVAASASTHLYCRIDPGNKRKVRHEHIGWADAREPLRIDSHGFFRQIERPGVGGESFSTESGLVAHVGPDLIRGRFDSSYVVSEESFEQCQTNRFPYRSPEVHFRARRVR